VPGSSALTWWPHTRPHPHSRHLCPDPCVPIPVFYRVGGGSFPPWPGGFCASQPSASSGFHSPWGPRCHPPCFTRQLMVGDLSTPTQLLCCMLRGAVLSPGFAVAASDSAKRTCHQVPFAIPFCAPAGGVRTARSSAPAIRFLPLSPHSSHVQAATFLLRRELHARSMQPSLCWPAFVRVGLVA
jgi:hypothetical protein